MMDVNKTIGDLFVKHINNVDKEFAAYYREKINDFNVLLKFLIIFKKGIDIYFLLCYYN